MMPKWWKYRKKGKNKNSKLEGGFDLRENASVPR
jgi:hypothetical protein